MKRRYLKHQNLGLENNIENETIEIFDSNNSIQYSFVADKQIMLACSAKKFTFNDKLLDVLDN